MKRFLRDMYAQKRLTDRILLQEPSPAECATMSIPVIICESNYDKYDNRRVDIVVTPTGLTDEARIRIQGLIGESVQTLPWSDEVMPDSELVLPNV